MRDCLRTPPPRGLGGSGKKRPSSIHSPDTDAAGQQQWLIEGRELNGNKAKAEKDMAINHSGGFLLFEDFCVSSGGATAGAGDNTIDGPRLNEWKDMYLPLRFPEDYIVMFVVPMEWNGEWEFLCVLDMEKEGNWLCSGVPLFVHGLVILLHNMCPPNDR